MKKPKLLLLDSDVIITCHELGIWQDLKAKYDIHVTSISVSEEVKHFKRGAHRIAIDLKSEVLAREITEVSATAPEMKTLSDIFTLSFAAGIDDGELEGLAVMKAGTLEDCRFCTGDTNAIVAVGMLGLKDSSISLEEALKIGGVPTPQGLPGHFSQRNRENQTKVGSERRITGECFKKSPLS